MNHFAFTELFAPATMNPADAKAAAIRAEHAANAEKMTKEQRDKVGGGLTILQVPWARKHDWFITKAKDKRGRDGVVVKDEIVKDGVEAVATVEFYDFQDLRDWAGY